MRDLKQFILLWDTQIKPLAVKCCEGVELMHAYESANTDEERSVIESKVKEYNRIDWNATYYISEMIFYVEHDLADQHNPAIRMLTVRGCLNSESYYTNVFNNIDCEECLNYKMLGKLLNQGMKLLQYCG